MRVVGFSLFFLAVFFCHGSFVLHTGSVTTVMQARVADILDAASDANNEKRKKAVKYIENTIDSEFVSIDPCHTAHVATGSHMN